MRSHAKHSRFWVTPLYMAPRTGPRTRHRWLRCRCVQSRRDFIPNADRVIPPVSGETPMEVLRRAAEQDQDVRVNESSCSSGSGDDLLKVSRERTGRRVIPRPLRWPKIERFCAGRHNQARPVANRPVCGTGRGAIQLFAGWPRLWSRSLFAVGIGLREHIPPLSTPRRAAGLRSQCRPRRTHIFADGIQQEIPHPAFQDR